MSLSWADMVEEELEDEMVQEPTGSWADLVEDELEEETTRVQEPEIYNAVAVNEDDLYHSSSDDNSSEDNSIEEAIPMYEQQLRRCYYDWQARQWRNRRNLWWTDPPPNVNDDGRQLPICVRWGNRQPRASLLSQVETPDESRLRDCYSAWQQRKLARGQELWWADPPPIINDDGCQPPLYVRCDYSRPGPSRLAQVEYPDKPDNTNIETDDTDSGYYSEEETISLPDLSMPEELTTSVENPVLTVTTPMVEEYPSDAFASDSGDTEPFSPTPNFRRYFFVKVANVLVSARDVVDTTAELVRRGRS